MSYVSLGRFQQNENGEWIPPAGVTALVDLVPPGQDEDPEVNFALMLSGSPLNQGDCHHSFGSGNVTEMTLTGLDRDAWESVTGFRPTATTIATCLAEHLLDGSDPTGEEFTRPLTAGTNRGLEIYLGGRIWSHTLTDWNDPLAEPVMRVEAEGLAAIYREQGETQYRLAMGGLHTKYQFYGPVKNLIQWLFPSGREDLPLMDELQPQTTKNENWNGTFPSCDHTWAVINGTGYSNSGNTLVRGTNFNVGRIRLDYAFGGSDITGQYVWVSVTGSQTWGALIRYDGADTAYFLNSIGNTTMQIQKLIAGSLTSLGASSQAITPNDVFNSSVSGSTLNYRQNGSVKLSQTDTSISSGLYGGFRWNGGPYEHNWCYQFY